MKRTKRALFISGFLAPAVLLYGWFVVVPLVQAFQLSLYRWSGISAHKTYIGTENYRELVSDHVFWKALGHNMWLLVVCGVALTVLGLLLAHATQGASRTAKLLRSVYLFPQVISLVAVAILWDFLYNPDWGLVNAALKAVHLKGLARTWLGDPHTALPALAVAFVWYALGFYVMIFSAGLRSIPAEITEAAELDGSVGLHRFRTVTWPMLWSIRRIAITYIVINVMNVFALVFIATNGGPSRATDVLLTYLYERGFTDSQFGYATAIATANFVLAMGLGLLVMFVFRRNPELAKT